MKRHLLVLLVALFVQMNTFGQIERDFWGLKLASATRQEVLEFLNSKKLKIIKNNEQSLITENLEYMGRKWFVIEFDFNSGVFCGIDFIEDAQDDPQLKELNDIWYLTQNLLLSTKYSNYKLEDLSKDNVNNYYDGTTLLIFNNSDGMISLSFYDVKIYNKILSQKSR